MSETNSNGEFLNKVYRNSQKAADAAEAAAKKVQDTNLLSDLRTQHHQYSAIKEKAAYELSKENMFPKEANPVLKSLGESGIQLNAMFDKSPDRIAEIMMKGSVEGIIDMTRVINKCENVSQRAKALGYELVTVEENNIRRMKNYLG